MIGLKLVLLLLLLSGPVIIIIVVGPSVVDAAHLNKELNLINTRKVSFVLWAKEE
jgi:hypothetical protein